jgi:hypothetical protein
LIIGLILVCVSLVTLLLEQGRSIFLLSVFELAQMNFTNRFILLIIALATAEQYDLQRLSKGLQEKYGLDVAAALRSKPSNWAPGVLHIQVSPFFGFIS